MNGLNQLTAAACTLDAGGRTWRLAPLTLADYGEIENRILGARPDPLAAVAEAIAGLPPEEQRAELGRALDRAARSRRVTVGDLDQWWQTAKGLSLRFWLMARKNQPETTPEAAGALLRQIGADGRASLVRQMEFLYGWPTPWPWAAAPPPDVSPDDDAFPWHRWLLALSRAYGWTLADISRLTIAQMCFLLGQPGECSGCRRMSLAEGVALCHRRRADRERWIGLMMERIGGAAGSEVGHAGPAQLAAMLAGAHGEDFPGRQDGDQRRQQPAGPDAIRLSPQSVEGSDPWVRVWHGPPSPSLGAAPGSDTPPLSLHGAASGSDTPPSPPHGAAPGSGTAPSAPPALPSAALAGLHGISGDAATGSNQMEQIRLAREMLAEQKKTNQYLEKQRSAEPAVFGP